MGSAQSSPTSESSTATAEVKEEQKVYVCLPGVYCEGEHTLSWALSHFPKDETKIVATSIIPTFSCNHPEYNVWLSIWRDTVNKTLDKHVAQCAIQKFKADKLIHENNGNLIRGILELIELKSIKNLVMWSSPNSELIKEKENPSCKIWFIQNGNLIYTRYPTSDLTEATSEEIDPGLNMALHLSLETDLQRRETLHQKEIEENQKRENESSMATAEVKEEQKVYVYLPPIYDDGKHILSWALSNFPKDETKIVATSIIPTSAPNHPRNNAKVNEFRENCNKILDKHLAQCAIHQFKAVKLTHDYCHNQESLELTIAEAILELIDLRAIKNLVMWSAPNSMPYSKIQGLVAEKANPTCKIWFIDLEGNLQLTRYSKSDMTKATSEEIDPGLNMALRLSLEMELQQKEKEIGEIQKRENEKNDLLKRNPKSDLTEATSEEHDQKVYVRLPMNYWVLSHFPKDETKIVATFIIHPISANNYVLNNTIDQHLAQCATQKFKAEKLIHKNGDTYVNRILELINLRAMKNLVLGFSPDSKVSKLVIEKANPSCKIWFQYGNLIYTRNPKSDLIEATSEEQIRREKQHHKEIEEIQKRENDKNDLLKREIEQLKLGNQLQRNELVKQKQLLREIIPDLEIGYNNLKQEHDNAIKEQIQRENGHQKEIEEIQKRENDKNDLLEREIEQLTLENQLQQNELDKQKQQLREIISDLQIGSNKLKQERDNAIKEAQQLRRQKEHSFGNSDMVLGTQFSLRELEQATENFSDSLKIGEGGFGCVYKGSLRKTTVAIKKLHSESLQGLSEFQQEVAILNRVRHPNIVNLIGSCSEISALVYEFLPNGSLEDRLTCADNNSSLTWQSRIRIISEICSGLVFLHSNKPHLVIHGDLKPENILLDANFISKLSDFGISKIIKQSDTNITALYHTSHVAGTFAYIDPEFLSTGELTPKADVYSFGIIVLRLLTGKPALKIANKVQEVMRAGRLSSIVDKSAGKWPSDLVEKLAKLGLRCSNISRKKRPDISQVWAMIEPLKADSLLSVGSSTSNEEHVPSHFICPIMQEIMKNPCIAADGFTYEAKAIKRWLNAGHNTSPMTNLMLPHRDLIPNHVLRSAIQEWLQQHPQSN